MSTVDQTRELAAFLRTRRERLRPGDVELPARRAHRRTPGLRREEVAELAGVSVDYVIRLEQGRGLRPSPEVLEALAAALRLSEDERLYLFDLARQRPTSRPEREGPADDEAGPLARLVLDLSPLPAMVLNHRFDIIAWNPEMAGLMLDFGTLPPRQRNSLWLCMLHPGLKNFFRDRERTIREGIADLRASWAAHPDDKGLSDLVEELTSGNEEFARLWAMRDVRVNARGRKRLRHAAEGPLTVEYEVLAPLQAPGQRLVIYRAADPESQRALDAIARSCAP
ncbi:DNA-binding protein [[Actinomadura] parvosata subsp. kistnae]|uniref:Transcriptional regulator n=1 Tax=[Actinomadura] parvosata subsp. kistnae TaxID=1909395 RepID=A0A1V0A3F6_9ACTN|nr:helix-turn-helix transcriptional regulator [Nonomuraea sp. ATCC 55076]AQZ64755.1 transcriptional regulator [Nonomuraea sp. ATCC 55076]SPL98496.1 DNA-binding protein [Actinomadura parvosata subsp. kistnae]